MITLTSENGRKLPTLTVGDLKHFLDAVDDTLPLLASVGYLHYHTITRMSCRPDGFHLTLSEILKREY